MSQHDLDIANQTFPNTRSDLNLALKALGSNQSGGSAPSTTFANQFFYNTTSNLLQIRNEDNDAYITIAELDQANDTVEYFKSDSIRTALIEFTDGDDALAIADTGAVTVSTSLDMDGKELILDADGDTTLHASTDDQIDVKIAGADDFKFTANSFNVLSGSTLTIDSGATITNSGTANGFGGGGITQADMYRLTTNVTSNTGTVTNWERCDDASYQKIGDGITESSGLFTFPATGVYAVRCMAMINPTDDNDSVLWNSFVTNGDDSSNDLVAETVASDPSTTVCSEFFVDVTSTANVKVKFGVGSLSGGGFISGNTSANNTAVTFVRLGDT